MKVYTKQDLQRKSAFNKNIESRNIIRGYKFKSPLPKAARALLLEMLTNSFTEYHAKQATYAQLLNVSVSTIKTALKDLKDLNLITFVRKTTGNVCVYAINHEAISALYCKAEYRWIGDYKESEFTNSYAI